MRGFDARGSWRAGRPPDLFDGRRQCRGGKFRLLWCAVGSGGDMQAAAASFPVVGAGGPVALQTSSRGEDSAEAGNSDFCGARPGAGEISWLPRGNVGRGSWRAGRPSDLFDGRRQCRGGKFRLLWCAVGSGGDMQDFRAGMLVVGAGGPVALQTSCAREKSEPG